MHLVQGLILHVLQASKHLLYPLCVPLARRCAPDSPGRPESLLAHSIARSPGSAASVDNQELALTGSA